MQRISGNYDLLTAISSLKSFQNLKLFSINFHTLGNETLLDILVECESTIEIPKRKLETWQNPNYVATVIYDHAIPFTSVAKVFELVPDISQINFLSNGDNQTVAFDIYFCTNEESALRDMFFKFGQAHNIEIAIQVNDVFRREKRLVVFDMDSTLIHQECIDEMARLAGVYDRISSITESAMRGEIDFNESLRQRVSLLTGHSSDIIEEIKSRLELKPGALDLCKALKRLGIKMAVVSGGFMPLADHIKSKLNLDYAFANNLILSNDNKTLTGKVAMPIVNGQRKAELLTIIAQFEKIESNQIVAVGDGANDLAMLALASIGIAYNAKPKVQEQAMFRLNQPSLLNILYFFGYNHKEITDLIK